MTLQEGFKTKKDFESYWLEAYKAACKNGTMLDVNFLAEVQKRYKDKGLREAAITEDEYERFLMILYNGD